MSFVIDKEERGLYFLLRITGEFTVQNLLRIRETVEEAMTVGHVYVAFDMSKTTMIDSSGIGLLVNLNQKLVAKGGSVLLIALPPNVLTAMDPSGVLQVLAVVNTIEEADRQIG
jgi:anti-sigma B factor antagonist